MLLLMVFRSFSSFAGAGLSRNVTGILLGLSLLVGFQTINFTSFLYLGAPIRTFSFLVQFVYFMVLGVFSYSLWEYRPARQLQPSSQARVTEVNEKLQRLMKLFRTPKGPLVLSLRLPCFSFSMGCISMSLRSDGMNQS